MLPLCCHVMAFMASPAPSHPTAARWTVPAMFEGNGCPMLAEPVQSSSEQTLTLAMG